MRGHAMHTIPARRSRVADRARAAVRRRGSAWRRPTRAVWTSAVRVRETHEIKRPEHQAVERQVFSTLFFGTAFNNIALSNARPDKDFDHARGKNAR